MPHIPTNLIADFYRQQHSALLEFLKRKLGSEEEANDVAQKTYERLLGASHADTIVNPRAFVFRVARNIAIDHLRQRQARGEQQPYELDNETAVSALPSPEDQADYELTVSLIRDVLVELPPKCRAAFLYYKFEEREYSEIAELLGVGESMVRKYVLRAISYCRSRIDQQDHIVSTCKGHKG